jgi:hypothetical protein
MSHTTQTTSIDNLLFRDGLRLENYYIERTPFGDFVCFIGSDGAKFDLLIEDSQRNEMAIARLLELGAPVVKCRV